MKRWPWWYISNAALSDQIAALRNDFSRKLDSVKEEINKVAAAISVFKQAVDQAFAQVNTNLDNIQQDEASLAQKITDLQAQVASGGSTLTPEAQQMLDDAVTAANAMVARTKTIADAVPDTVAPPAIA